MTIEAQINDLERDIRRLQETAEENNVMLKAICETLGIERPPVYGDYSGPEVPLRALVDSIGDMVGLVASIVDKGQQ